MKKIFLTFFISLIFLETNVVFAAIPCNGDQTRAKAPDELAKERVYLDGLYADLRKAEDLLTQIEAVSGKETNNYKNKESEVIKKRAEVDAAAKICGATEANQKQDKEELKYLSDQASKTGGGSSIPAYYKPISPLPIPEVSQGGVYRVDNLISGGFTFAMIIAVFLSVVMIIRHGLGYILSGDSFAGKKFETKRLQDIIIGLLIILCSVVILNTIDPNIVALNVDLSNPGAKTNPEVQKSGSGVVEGGNTTSGGGGTGTNTSSAGTGGGFGGDFSNTPARGSVSGGGNITGGNSGGNVQAPAGNSAVGGTSQNPNKKTNSFCFSIPGLPQQCLDDIGLCRSLASRYPNAGACFRISISTHGTGKGKNGDPTIVRFCYKYRRKSNGALEPQKCVAPSFEACIADKKKTQKTDLFYKFTQCKIEI